MNRRSLCYSLILLGLSLAAAPVSAQPTEQNVANENEVNTPVYPADEQAGEAVDTGREAPPEPATRQGRRPPQRTSIIRNNTDKYLAILGLLFLWLLTRKENERKELRLRPDRKAPVTVEELGRAVYAAVRSEDITGFRTLHIDGKEAGTAMGVDSATQYLRDRTQEKLNLNMTELSEKIPLGSQYRAGKITEQILTLTLVTQTGEIITLEVGTVTQIGAVLRLV